MKKMMVIFFLGTLLSAKSQTHSLEKIWETDTIIPVPESILPDLQNNILYVSLVNGGGWAADGIGGVGKLSSDGKKFDADWITGLNAPKGLGRFENSLYVADITEVVKIDITNGEVVKKIAIKDAEALNDITVDHMGTVYVSDTKQGKIWSIKNDVPTLYLDNLPRVNGLKAIGDQLYIGADKHFLRSDANKKLVTVAQMPEAIDGIEPVGNGDFLLTSWIGYIYYLSSSGSISTLLDSHAENMNTADIAFDPTSQILYLPTFNAKKVIAYRLK